MWLRKRLVANEEMMNESGDLFSVLLLSFCTSLQIQWGVNFFLLDSRRVFAPAPKVPGPKQISHPVFACKPF